MDASVGTGWVARARDTLLAAAEALPLAHEVEAHRERFAEAEARGWLRPEEDEEVQRLFSRYLRARTALHEVLASLRHLTPHAWQPFRPPSLPVFVTAWLAGCMLMRGARYLAAHFQDAPLVRARLNQAMPEMGVPEGMFDAILRSSTRMPTVIRFLRAARYAEQRGDEIAQLRNDPLVGPLLPLLEAEAPFIEQQKRRHAQIMARCRLDRIARKPGREYRRVVWGILEASGRAIAEMRNPLHRKRVTRHVRREVAALLQPGDLLVTRHDDALSNLFLPGFWPHAAFVIGHEAQREELGLDGGGDRAARCRPPICVLEAKKDGVRFRALRETLRVDAFVLLRPLYSSDDVRRRVVERAMAHEGKLYDFSFDFTRADRLVCTEVVWRALDGQDGFRLDPLRRAGRYALSAEDLLRQLLAAGRAQVLMLYGVKGNRSLYGERAGEILLRSLGQC